MELSNKDKLMICGIYDQILRKNEMLTDLISEEEKKELQKNPNYRGKNYQEQMDIIMTIVRGAQKMNPALGTEDIIKFITDPGFRVRLDIENNALQSDRRTLQDSVILRRTFYQTIIGNPIQEELETKKVFKKPIKVTKYPVIKVTRVDVSDDMFYVYEEIMYISEMVKDKLMKKIEENQRNRQLNGEIIPNIKRDTAELLWNELESREYTKYQIQEPTIHRSIEKIHIDFKDVHGIKLAGKWTEGQSFIIDNRPHMDALISENNPVGTLQLKTQFKSR